MLREGGTPETLLAGIFADIPHYTLEKGGLALACSCNRRRLERVVVSLGQQEIETLIAEHGAIEITCEFCRATYRFEKRELEEILTSS